jgi:3-oxoacyl-[acyl-carrier protein] reductase
MASGSVRTLSIKRVPLRRFATPAEVGEVIRFLAGPRSSYVTGQTLQVDGGLSLT